MKQNQSTQKSADEISDIGNLCHRLHTALDSFRQSCLHSACSIMKSLVGYSFLRNFVLFGGQKIFLSSVISQTVTATIYLKPLSSKIS